MIKECPYCGEKYKELKNIPLWFPEFIREQMRFQPKCSCLKDIVDEKKKQEEEEREKEIIRKKVKKYMNVSLIDKKFLKSKFENDKFNEKILKISQKYAKAILEQKNISKGILFIGDSGVGKTFISSCIANYLMDNGKTVLIINLGLYLNKIKREWAEAENDILNYIKKCDLLIIDDFGGERVTEFVIEKAFLMIDTRYRSEKPMIITTNLNLSQLEKKFNAKIKNRIEEMCYPLLIKSKKI